MRKMADDKKSVNPLTTGVVGAVIGAAATAAAIALSDEKNRKKVEAVLSDLQKQGDKVLKEITKRALDIKDMGDRALSKNEPKKIKSGKRKS